MLLERRSRPIRGVRVVFHDTAPFAIQIIPTRRLDAEEVRRTLDRLPDVTGPVVTSALSTMEQEPFRECGFVERESLHLLRHDFSQLPPRRSGARVRPARRGDAPAVLEMDKLSFDRFWTFDRHGLAAARRATPTSRYVVATLGDRTPVGYAITGFAGASSFLQRLAVHPEQRGQQIGTHLIADGIEWARGRGATHMMVNTQTSNAHAFDLYQRLGFAVQKDQLKVLEYLP